MTSPLALLVVSLVLSACDAGTPLPSGSASSAEALGDASASRPDGSSSPSATGASRQAGTAGIETGSPGGVALHDSTAVTTPGFEGAPQGDGTVRLSWRPEPGAAGYNVYRQGRYLTTVHAERYTDASVSASDGTVSYEIHAFTAGEAKTFRKIAENLVVDMSASAPLTVTGTSGFTGTLEDEGTVRLRWRPSAGAAGYNVYRQGRYLTTVHTESHADRSLPAGTYRYEIHAFTGGEAKTFRKVAHGLTIEVPVSRSGGSGNASPNVGGGLAADRAVSDAPPRDFVSSSTADFKARLRDDGSVRLSWRADPNAEGYNVYRQGRYHTTVRTNSYTDTTASGRDYRYEIHSFTRGTPKRFAKIATDLTVRVPAPVTGGTPSRVVGSGDGGNEAAAGRTPAPERAPALAKRSVETRDFTSVTTPGFTARLLDNGDVHIRWKSDPDAEGYNVYRNAKYHTTVNAAEFTDTDLFDRDYYYEIQSFTRGENKRFRRVATGLTVKVRGLGRLDPKAPRPDPTRLDGYDLVFADEFDTGTLDTSKWNTSYLWGADLTINSEKQYYVDIKRDPDFGFDPFTFEDGKLVINSIRTPAALREKANGKPYLSGVITSYDAFKFTYGYAEMRARMPYGKGYWTAFWLLNAYYGNEDPEIDIVEFIGHDQDVAYHTYHYFDGNGNLRSTKSEPTPGIDFTADFHTFGVDWRPGSLVYYIDDVEVHRISDPEVSDQDMYLIANTALGGWWPGSPDDTTPFPGRYEIDYIRVYRQRAPYASAPFSDAPSGVLPAPDAPSRMSPGHRPPFELWPDGYPARSMGER